MIGEIYREFKRDHPYITTIAKFALGGAVIGGVAGVALPVYVGWDVIGEQVKKNLEVGQVAGYATKALATILVTNFAAGITGAIGAAAGGTVGAGVGVAVAGAHRGLDSIVGRREPPVSGSPGRRVV